MKTIKQVVIEDVSKISIQTADMPTYGEDEVLLKLLYGGICGSDLSVYKGVMAGSAYPRIAGHEFSAEVVAVGRHITDLPVGTIVTGNPYFNCGTCYSCQRGLVNCCVSNETAGVQRDGVFRQYITLPRTRVYDGKGVLPQKLALVEPFCIGYHAAKRAHICKGEKVLIVGAGTIGMMAALAVLTMGGEVTLCDVSPDKLKLADTFGVHHTILNDGSRPLSEYVAEFTGGNGYDIAIEAVGLPQTVDDCINSLAFGGRAVLIGVVKHSAEFLFDKIRHKYLTVIGSRNALREDFEAVVDIVRSDSFPVDQLISKIFPMEDAADAFDFFAKHGDTNFKIMLKF